jgi:hypothetical protein
MRRSKRRQDHRPLEAGKSSITAHYVGFCHALRTDRWRWGSQASG